MTTIQCYYTHREGLAVVPCDAVRPQDRMDAAAKRLAPDEYFVWPTDPVTGVRTTDRPLTIGRMGYTLYVDRDRARAAAIQLAQSRLDVIDQHLAALLGLQRQRAVVVAALTTYQAEADQQTAQGAGAVPAPQQQRGSADDGTDYAAIPDRGRVA